MSEIIKHGGKKYCKYKAFQRFPGITNIDTPEMRDEIAKLVFKSLGITDIDVRVYISHSDGLEGVSIGVKAFKEIMDE